LQEREKERVKKVEKQKMKKKTTIGGLLSIKLFNDKKSIKSIFYKLGKCLFENPSAGFERGSEQKK